VENSHKKPLTKPDNLSNLGGVGLRPPHYHFVLENKPAVGFFEVISENFLIDGGRPLHVLDKVRQDYPISLHGVSMSLGSKDDLNADYLRKLKSLINRVDPLFVSDHLCWTGVHGKQAHDLWPLPYTVETIDWVVGKIQKVQDYLQREIMIENVSTYLEFQDSEMTEWEFLDQVVKKSGCGLLCDINNIYVSCFNHGLNPMDYLKTVPFDRVFEVHLAGPSEQGQYLVDTHDHPVKDEVWNLYSEFIKLAGPRPTLIEWDDNIPEFSVLMEEVEKAERIWEKHD